MTRYAFLLLCSVQYAVAAGPSERVLDNFDSPASWQVQHTDDVSATLQGADGKTGKALRMDFNFTDAHGQPINGYATARRALPLDLPDNFELSFWIRGEAGVNAFQFKLVDASGDNVWWYNRPDFELSHDWQQIRVRRRQIEFAWGPTTDHTLRHAASIEFVVSSGRDGGKGSVYIDDLVLRELPPPDKSPAQVRVTATSALKDAPASAAMDGDAQSEWRSDPSRGPAQQLDIDLGKPREVGGFVLHWQYGEHATAWTHEESVDGKQWSSCAGQRERLGDLDLFTVCDNELRYLRLKLTADEGHGYGMHEIEVKDAGWGATQSSFYQDIAKRVTRGSLPRGLVEQPYWTIVGVDGAAGAALFSEDGAIEPRKGGWSIEPFVTVDGARLTWADVRLEQSLADGYLPLPEVDWTSAKVKLEIEAFGRGTSSAPQVVTRYRLHNTTGEPLEAILRLAIRPFQVNPPTQFLNSPGGFSAITNLRLDGTRLDVNDSALWLSAPPVAFVPLGVDAQELPGRVPAAAGTALVLHDDFGHASGALVYKLKLPAQGEREVDVVAPLTKTAAASAPGGMNAEGWAEQERNGVEDSWRGRLERVQLTVPRQAQRIVDAVRTAQAHMLLSRDGPALRPGTRSYARSWIRDGAMIADALLRLGEIEAVRDYVNWYAPHQFANGKVPCCVDHRGSDPVPENDSHGQLIHAIAQLYRYGGDRAQLQKNWPHIEAAIAYMDSLRAGETGAANAAFKGLMPASISHEGYSAKPMHSYWDDFWALTGYKDAAEMAQVLGNAEAVARIGLARDEFERDVQASIAAAVQQRSIDFIPGSAELGDFDATSTTIALSPAGESDDLPQELLRNTFERYWRNFAARASGGESWNDYTPYEWRTVSTFVRLGQRDRAQAAIDFFFTSGVRPPEWNQWAEVVRRDPRQSGFIGDMPHAWVASDFVRSALDLFAYERAEDKSIVLAAGIPAQWIDGAGIAVDHLRTPYGELSYALKRSGKRIELRVAGAAAPPGGFVFAGPFASGASVSINDGPASDSSEKVRFAKAPATVVIVE
jgi:hypothetical protein